MAGWLVGTAALDAAVQVASPFRPNMVLQRNRPVPVWGWAAPGEAVSVSFGGNTVSTTTSEDGRWRVDLPAMEASTTPRTLTVTGTNTINFGNVLVGDVWFASGQSNMEWEVEDARDAAAEIAAANYPLIRLATVAQIIALSPNDTVDVVWQECSPATIAKFSAVAYYFGRALHQELGVPIGLVDAAWGGTPVEAWMSLETLQSDPAFKPVFDRWDDSITKKTSTVLYNGIIRPWFPFSLQGVIWYQGEENAPRYTEYRKLFPTMIEEWRREFQQPELPFYFVLLANMNRSNDPTGRQWAFLREAQLAALALPATAAASAIDIGEDNNIHPLNKQDVGARLARIALARLHGRDIVDEGPTFSHLTIEGAAVRVHFRSAEGLHSVATGVPGFEVAGRDRVFHPATSAAIEGTTVVVSSAAVPAPRYVRYAFVNNPERSLYNAAGLPAVPFRSGTWFGTEPSTGVPVRPLANDHVAVGESPDAQRVTLYNPAIHRLPSGRLLASYTLNGDTTEMGLPSQRVLSSDDGGKTWQVRREYFGNARITQGRFFTAGSRTYLMGQYTNVRIAVSEDGGTTWSNAVNLTSGERWQSTPANVIHRNGRVYLAMDRLVDTIDAWEPSVYSPVIWRANENDDLLQRSSWTLSEDLVFRDIIPGFTANQPEIDGFGVPFFPQAYPTSQPVGGTRRFHPMGWLEGNLAQINDPQSAWYDPTGRTWLIWLRANTGGTGYAALLRVVEQEDGRMVPGLATSPAGATMLFPTLPGGHMRFHLLEDPETGLHWLLGSQPTDSMRHPALLPEDRYAIPNEERHRMVLHVSRNLVDWHFAGLVAMGGGNREARHYASMEIDGGDLVILSRSGDARAKNAHDGNLITFHRVRQFRNLAPPSLLDPASSP